MAASKLIQSYSYATADGQLVSYVLVSSTHLDFYCNQKVSGLLVWGNLSEESMSLLLTVAASPH
jgi:hypothetical protein